MSWFKNSWKSVEKLLYDEAAAITAAKYYLYEYLVEVLGISELKSEFLELENRIYNACFVYLFVFVFSRVSVFLDYPEFVRIEEQDLQKLRSCGINADCVVEDEASGKPIEIAFVLSCSHHWNVVCKNLVNSCFQSIVCDIISRESLKFKKLKPFIVYDLLLCAANCREYADLRFEYLSQQFESREDVASYLSEVRKLIMTEDVLLDIPWIDTAIDMLTDFDCYSIRSFIDGFFQLEHCTGQLLVHTTIELDSEAEKEFNFILDAIRKGKIYSLFKYLVAKKERLPSIVYKYAFLLPK